MRRVLPLALLALLLAAAAPVDAGHSFPNTWQAHDGDRAALIQDYGFYLDQGGTVFHHVTVYNNGTTDRAFRLDARSSNANGTHGLAITAPNGTIPLAAGMQTTVPVNFTGPTRSPTGRYENTITVAWDDGLDQELMMPLQLEPPYFGVALQLPSMRFAYDRDAGAWLPFNLSYSGGSRASTEVHVRATLEAEGGYAARSPMLSVPLNGTNKEGMQVYFEELPDTVGGAYQLAVSVEIPGLPRTRPNLTQRIPMDVEPAPAPVTVRITPESATVAPGANTTYTVSVTENLGRSPRIALHHEVEAASDGSTPWASLYPAMMQLTPYQNATAQLYVRAANGTTPTMPGTYDISVTYELNGTRGAPARATFVVDGYLPRATVGGNLTPEAARAPAGGEAVYELTIRESSGTPGRVELSAWARGNASAKGVPAVTLSPAAFDIDAYGEVRVEVRVVAQNGTRAVAPGEYEVQVYPRVIHRQGVDHAAMVSAAFIVEPLNDPEPRRENVTLQLDPRETSAQPGGNVSFSLDLAERAGLATMVVLDARLETAGPAPVVTPTIALPGRVALGAHESATLSVRVDASNRSNGIDIPATPNEYTLVIRARSDSGDLAAETRARFVVEPAPLADVLATADPVSATPNATAIVRVRLFNAGTAEAQVRLAADLDVALSLASVSLAPGASAMVDASLVVPATATNGTTLLRTLTLSTEPAQEVPLVVHVVAPPVPRPIAQEPFEGIPPPVAAAGALVALGMGAFAVARAEPLRYGAMVAALPLYTRLAKPEMLSDERRGEIHALIVATPGIHLGALQAATKLSSGALVHHLRMLQRHGFVTSERQGRLRRFYVSGAARPAMPPATGVQEQVLGLLAAGPLTRPEIADRLGLSQQGVSYHVKNLERAGRVVVRHDGRSARVHRVYDMVVAHGDDLPPSERQARR